MVSVANEKISLLENGSVKISSGIDEKVARTAHEKEEEEANPTRKKKKKKLIN